MKYIILLMLAVVLVCGCGNPVEPELQENFILHIIASAEFSESGLCYSYPVSETEGYSVYVDSVILEEELLFEIPQSADKNCICVMVGLDGQSNCLTAWLTPSTYGARTGGNYMLAICGGRN